MPNADHGVSTCVVPCAFFAAGSLVISCFSTEIRRGLGSQRPHSCGLPSGLLAQPFYGWVAWTIGFIRGLLASFYQAASARCSKTRTREPATQPALRILKRIGDPARNKD